MFRTPIDPANGAQHLLNLAPICLEKLNRHSSQYTLTFPQKEKHRGQTKA